jgi:AGZA family xanthine/uracil permease-like MFS transporter
MAETMLVDGLGTIIGACFGSYYSTTVYIGHPIHKALGARRGFSVFNGILYFILHFVGKG